MKKYQELLVSIAYFQSEDVVRTSGIDAGGFGDDDVLLEDIY